MGRNPGTNIVVGNSARSIGVFIRTRSWEHPIWGAGSRPAPSIQSCPQSCCRTGAERESQPARTAFGFGCGLSRGNP